MKTNTLIAALVCASGLGVMRADDACPCPEPATVSAVPADGLKRHPLKGVVTGVLTDRSALLVKHEEIPGVMKAMTMLLKVDEAAIKAPTAREGAAITGLLVKKDDGWWLESVKPATADGAGK